MTDRCPAIEDPAVISDPRAVALVDTGGTIDWCCLPRLDSPAMFVSLGEPRRRPAAAALAAGRGDTSAAAA
jgi:Domain of unknown function (DUF5911)